MLDIALPDRVAGTESAPGEPFQPTRAQHTPADPQGGSTDPDRPPEQAVREQMARIVRSDLFAQSERLNRFLRFTVDAALAGRAETLKEYTIGTRVYDRRGGYAPSQDSIVRTEARRLRGKLAEYYASAGRTDPVVISFRPGSYAPQFQVRPLRTGLPAPTRSTPGDLLVAGPGLAVAVRPFTGLSEDGRSDVQARALADELTYCLARTEGVRVVGVGTPPRHGADGRSPSGEPGAQVTFEGTVREVGNQVRVTCRAVAANGDQIWAQRFECESDALPGFALAERVASATVSRTRPEQSLIRRMRASPTPWLMDLYPAVLAAESLLDEGEISGLRAAASRFDGIVRFAPDYPRPYWGLARCYHELAHRGVPLSPADVTRAGDVAATSVAIDPEAIVGHAALAGAQSLAWDWEAAGQSYRRAIALGPHAGTCRSYGLFLVALGRLDEGWHHLEAAQEIDPFSQAQKAAMAKGSYFSRQPDGGGRHVAPPVGFGPFPLTAHVFAALTQLRLGRTSVALEPAAAARIASGGQPADLAALAEITALGGDVAAAKRIASTCGPAEVDAGVSWYRRALLLLALGDDQAALTALTRACADRDAELIWLAVEPRFDRVRSHPRFASALEQVGLRHR